MLTKQGLVDAISWEAALSAPRYAGGHEDVMRSLFYDSARVIADWTENSYDGDLAYAYQFPCGTVAIVTDYFGSCSGCDAWEDATDEQARNMIRELAINARLFPSVKAAADFCEGLADPVAEDYPMIAARNLADALREAK